MNQELLTRSGSNCELCETSEHVKPCVVPPKAGDLVDEFIMICSVCKSQMEGGTEDLNVSHLRCLNQSAWSEVPAVQVVAYRLLKQLKSEDWAQNLLGMMYLDEETTNWAESNNSSENIKYKDSNGHILLTGDSVVLIKDLNVKGANFTAKRGTAVRRIRLDPNNINHIEGKVNGQQIVILTQYVKKSS